MSSWELGKIFAVDENKESDQNDDDPNYVSDSDSESEDDEDARARAAAFAKSKRSNTTCPVTGSNRSIRRYDEYGSFITRSERARKEKTEELPPSAIKDSKDGKEKIVKGKGKVCFRGGSLGIGEGLLDIKEIPEWTEDEKMLLFMTRANWEAIDTDIDITEMRWKNHMEGKIKFDEDNNTVRGIEEIIFNINNGKFIRHHRKVVLEEVNRQKIEKEYPDWQKLADVSNAVTQELKEKAVQLAQEDEKERKRVWSESTSNAEAQTQNVASSSAPREKKKKGGLFGFFKKKSK